MVCKQHWSQRPTSRKQQLWEPSGVFDICSRSSLLLQQCAPWNCAGGRGWLGRAFVLLEMPMLVFPQPTSAISCFFIYLFFSFYSVCMFSVFVETGGVMYYLLRPNKYLKYFSSEPTAAKQCGATPSGVWVYDGASGILSGWVCLSSTCSRSTRCN